MGRFGVELRAEVAGDKLAGHAAVFDSLAQVRGGWEELSRTAFDQSLRRGDDVRALVNHNPALLLGRTAAGTLRLSTDSTGLQFEVDLPKTSYADDLRELVARGDLTGASFGFTEGTYDRGTGPDGRQLRTHTSIGRLLDVSAVTYPAYEDTEVQLRHRDFIRTDWRRHNRERLLRARAALHRREHV